MGLDLTIYKENKKGKRQEVAYFSSNGWPIVAFLRRKLNKKELYDDNVILSIKDVRELITCCKEVLLAYYERSFENPRSWVDIAIAVFDSYDKEYYSEYNDDYIYKIGTIYEKLWSIQEELYDNETVILDISY